MARQTIHKEPWLALLPRPLVVARAAWLVVVGLVLCLLGASLWGAWTHLSLGSSALIRSEQSLEPATRQALAQLGLGVTPYIAYHFAMQLGFTLVFAAIGFVIAWRRPDDWLTVFVSLTLIAFSVTTSSITDGLLSEQPPWSWLVNTVQAVGTGGWLLLFLLFPDGRWVPRWTRWLAYGWMVIVVLWLFVPTLPLNMLYGDTWLRTPVASFLVAVIVFNTGVFAQAYRYRFMASAEQRQQTKWVLFGFVATSLAGTLRYLPPLVYPELAQPGVARVLYEAINQPITAALTLLLPLGLGFAILRHRLWEIDILINRTLVYGALTGSVIAVYVLIVGGLGALFQTRGSFLISLLATGVVAMLFHPLRERLQRAANRLLWGERDDPYAVLSRLGQRLELALAPDAVLPTVVTTIVEALKLPYVAIALVPSYQQRSAKKMLVEVSHAAAPFGDTKPSTEAGGYLHGVRVQQDKPAAIRVSLMGAQAATGAGSEAAGSAAFAIVAAVGTAVADTLALPLIYRGELVGQLILGPRSPGEPFSSADRRLLGDIAHQVGVAAHAVRLNADLQRSRERLVLAREEERRRLRRDLHDGLGPALAAHTLKVGAARAFVSHDPQVADRLLEELETDIDAALQDVRRLVYNLRPPALDQWGLVGAIRESATHYPSDGPPAINVAAPGRLPPLPAAVEVAAYRIVQEAQTNVRRHAQARHCSIQLQMVEAAESKLGFSALEVEVVDDGIGLPQAYRTGVGIQSMHERAAELGGSCIIEPRAGGGTRVWARLPLM